MHFRHIFIICFYFLFVNTSFSQQEKMYSIKGKVLDKSGTPIPYALVAIYDKADSALISGIASDDKGDFTVKIPPGNYYAKVSFLSYKEKIIETVMVNSGDVDLGKIILVSNTELLNEVEIVSEKNQMELHLDKRVFNVGKDLNNAGNNAAEILDNVPSVNVDVDGNVSLRGSDKVRILIDGKPSGLVGISKTDALRMLQGSMIESIEVITNPSARYDAEGEVGIINIILKKEKRMGINGTFEASVGYPDNYSASYSINYRKNKINLFSSYGISYRMGPGSGKNKQEFSGDTVYSFTTNRTHNRGGLANNLRIGTDYFVNNFNTITLAGLYKYSYGVNKAKIIYNDYNFADVLTQTVERNENEYESQQNIELELNHKKTFLKKGKEWSTGFKWVDSDDSEYSDIFQVTDLAGGENITQRTDNVEDERNLFFQSDFVYPFASDGKFEAGTKAISRLVNNSFKVEQLQIDDTWFVLPDFDNNMVYTENIYAAYLMAGNKKNKFGYQAGIRAEYSDISTELLKTNEVNPRSYMNFFPSAHFSYKIDSTNTMQLSYSRRLNRPKFRELLPYYGFADSRSFFSGNPDLNPEYTNSYEAGYLYYFKKGSLLSSVYYRHRTGVIERITVVDTTGFIRIFPINLSVQDAYGIEFSANYELAKWWKINGSFNFFRAITSGSYDAQNFNIDTYNWIAKLNSKITLYKKVDWQTSFDYTAPQNTAQGRALSMYALDMGFSSDILKGKATLTLSGKDLLNTRRRRVMVDTPGFYSETNFQWRSRQFLLTFSYRLNQMKKKPSQRPEGFDDEGGI